MDLSKLAFEADVISKSMGKSWEWEATATLFGKTITLDCGSNWKTEDLAKVDWVRFVTENNIENWKWYDWDEVQ